ncbi:hypothetical protein NBRC116494_32470 [Aurantivibrio plasticivorans]
MLGNYDERVHKKWVRSDAESRGKYSLIFKKGATNYFRLKLFMSKRNGIFDKEEN